MLEGYSIILEGYSIILESYFIGHSDKFVRSINRRKFPGRKMSTQVLLL